MPNSNGFSVQLVSGFREIAGTVDLVICDLWGVMHNGLQLHQEAVKAIMEARENGLQTVFLSNAPRPRFYVRDHLRDMGLPEALLDFVVTSGGLARDEVRRRFAGAKLYHLGPADDQNTIEGLPVDMVEHPDDADLILATDLDFPDVESHRAHLRAAAEKEVPFLCANPDRVVHVGDKLYLCAGSVADLYGSLGGPVHWFGKPTAEALTSCVAEVGIEHALDGRRIVMIGDSLQTDMAGASAAGYQGLFIAGGIHRDEIPLLAAQEKNGFVSVDAFKKIFGEGKAIPHAVMNKLSW